MYYVSFLTGIQKTAVTLFFIFFFTFKMFLFFTNNFFLNTKKSKIKQNVNIFGWAKFYWAVSQQPPALLLEKRSRFTAHNWGAFENLPKKTKKKKITVVFLLLLIFFCFLLFSPELVAMFSWITVSPTNVSLLHYYVLIIRFELKCFFMSNKWQNKFLSNYFLFGGWEI